MTRTIQKQHSRVRREFFEHAAALYGTSLDAELVDAAEGVSDLDAVALVFPCLDDAERHEVLWALGNFEG
jgi:hypothetical protein